MYKKIDIQFGKFGEESLPKSCSLSFIVKKGKDDEIREALKEHPFNELQVEALIEGKCSEIECYWMDETPAVETVHLLKLDKKFDQDYFRNYLAGFIGKIFEKGICNLEVVIPEYKQFSKYFTSEEYYYQSFVEGLLLGNYEFDKYKSKKEKIDSLEVIINSSNEKLTNSAIVQGEYLIESVSFAKDLVNEPAIVLTPMELAKRAEIELVKFGVDVTVLTKTELEDKKMGGILAVGGASANDPCLIKMEYKPKGKAKKKVALVGKGVTYDAGGLSIKPTSGMVDMNADMSGAAVVIGIIKAAAMNNVNIELVGFIPAVENMISGNSYKPGDILTSYSGKTIEVKDTDAEGRLVLADALTYASEHKPDEIIDFATLTGACVAALGEFTGGLFTDSDKIAEGLSAAGNKTYERVWRMPFWKEFDKLIESDIADVSNLGPRWGGAITAGKFLENFVDDKIDWAHLDIAGPATKHKFKNYTEKWHTAFGIRLVYEYLSK